VDPFGGSVVDDVSVQVPPVSDGRLDTLMYDAIEVVVIVQAPSLAFLVFEPDEQLESPPLEKTMPPVVHEGRLPTTHEQPHTAEPPVGGVKTS
jgi:hypothetical protein